MSNVTLTSQLVRELIVYVCPIGDLAAQLQAYYDATRAAVGPNTAHRYMPHISLTGFFHDQQSAVPGYEAALQRAMETAMAAIPGAGEAIQITGMRFQDAFHYLQIESPWLERLSSEFAQIAESPTRTDVVRVKDFLHLSLAYGFEPQQGTRLAQLARELINVRSQVGWELRFYERHTGDRWTVHKSWTLV